MHGKSSLIRHNRFRRGGFDNLPHFQGEGVKGSVLDGLPNPFSAIRYHSLIVRRETLPDCLEVTAWTDDGTIMGLRHRSCLLEGVQFHPESILTTEGKNLLRNFLELA